MPTVKQALADQTGSLLVFLPGQAEIRRLYQRLVEDLQGCDDIVLAPLFGDLSLSQQRLAIAPVEPGKRKVVLATSIAETSLTIDGVRVVIDAGLSRLPVFDPATGMTLALSYRVPRRAARWACGRLEPGVLSPMESVTTAAIACLYPTGIGRPIWRPWRCSCYAGASVIHESWLGWMHRQVRPISRRWIYCNV